MEELVETVKTCVNCSRSIPTTAHYCKFCGAFQIDEEEEKEEAESKKWLRLVAIFYGIDLLICTVVNFIDYFRGLAWLLITEAVLAVFTMLFLAFLWKDIKYLFSWKSFTIPKALVYGGAAILFAVVVNMIVKWLNIFVFDEDIYFYYSFGHLQFPKIAMILMVALMPAIFEELAYRGIILQGLFNVLDEKQAIFISAFFFAVIHMSFISFFWLLPFAIWLGNVRWKEETIWYGVLIHFCFNTTACLLEFYQLDVL